MFPSGVALDGSGNLYVADHSNNRVVEYNTPLSTNTTADLVFGQGGNFASTRMQQRRGKREQPELPIGVALDASGNLYIADIDNNRVLEYNTPLTTGTPPPIWCSGRVAALLQLPQPRRGERERL